MNKLTPQALQEINSLEKQLQEFQLLLKAKTMGQHLRQMAAQSAGALSPDVKLTPAEGGLLPPPSNPDKPSWMSPKQNKQPLSQKFDVREITPTAKQIFDIHSEDPAMQHLMDAHNALRQALSEGDSKYTEHDLDHVEKAMMDHHLNIAGEKSKHINDILSQHGEDSHIDALNQLRSNIGEAILGQHPTHTFKSIDRIEQAMMDRAKKLGWDPNPPAPKPKSDEPPKRYKIEEKYSPEQQRRLAAEAKAKEVPGSGAFVASRVGDRPTYESKKQTSQPKLSPAQLRAQEADKELIESYTGEKQPKSRPGISFQLAQAPVLQAAGQQSERPSATKHYVHYNGEPIAEVDVHHRTNPRAGTVRGKNERDDTLHHVNLKMHAMPELESEVRAALIDHLNSSDFKRQLKAYDKPSKEIAQKELKKPATQFKPTEPMTREEIKEQRSAQEKKEPEKVNLAPSAPLREFTRDQALESKSTSVAPQLPRDQSSKQKSERTKQLQQEIGERAKQASGITDENIQSALETTKQSSESMRRVAPKPPQDKIQELKTLLENSDSSKRQDTLDRILKNKNRHHIQEFLLDPKDKELRQKTIDQVLNEKDTKGNKVNSPDTIRNILLNHNDKSLHQDVLDHLLNEKDTKGNRVNSLDSIKNLLLNHDNEHIRQKVADSIFDSGRADHIRKFLLNDKNPNTHKKAIDVLNKIQEVDKVLDEGKADNIKDLLLNHEDSVVRKITANNILDRGDTNYIKDLLLNHEDPAVRTKAANHVLHSGHKDHIKDLLFHSDPHVRRAAFNKLEELRENNSQSA
jgi:hypothetical protein